MRRRSAGITVALLLCCASTLGLAQTTMTADEAKQKIAAAGYWMISDITPTGDGGYTAIAMKGDDMMGVKVSKDGKVQPTK